MNFAEAEACIAAGLDYFKWESGDYPRWFKAKIVAWHGLHHAVESHTIDANTPTRKK